MALGRQRPMEGHVRDIESPSGGKAESVSFRVHEGNSGGAMQTVGAMAWSPCPPLSRRGRNRRERREDERLALKSARTQPLRVASCG